MMKQRTPTRIVSKERILRAVASSSAIETNESITQIENRLRNKKSRFSDLQLAR
ncbi:hypothetical protein [Oceanospirillum linum]|uniref:hypothetical protein n=1 Tax=Oceanospirillum TaxID=965 RepID=UPI00135A3E08|nr:hypothetical protein [Oceanospirillum linum]